MDAAPAGDRSIAPKPSGDSISPLEAHAAFLFTLNAQQPDLALDEIVAAMHKRRIRAPRTDPRSFVQTKQSSPTQKSQHRRTADITRHVVPQSR